MKRIITIVIVLVLIGTSFVEATEIRTFENLIRVDPQYPDYYTDLFNWSDPANQQLSNYNQTIVPFMDETNISGTFTGTFMPPILSNISDDTSPSGSWISSVCRFKSSWIMSGSSYSWWRIPVNNLTGFTFVNLTIWHVDNPVLLNVTDKDYGYPNEMSRPTKVYSNSYVNDEKDQIWLNQTVIAWDWGWDFVWLRVVAPIHSDESYYVRFMYSHLSMIGGQQVMFAQTDTADDSITKTWYYSDDTDEIFLVEADLDISVIHEFGMGYGVSGFEIPTIYLPSDEDFITESITPTGSTEGLDGDWSSNGASVQIDVGDKVAGTLSIKGNDLDYDEHVRYEFDEPLDLSIYNSLKFHVKPEDTMDLIRVRMYTDSSNYAQISKSVVVDIWNYVEIEINPSWADWGESGSPDMTSIAYLDIINYKAATTNLDIKIDNLYFFVGNLSIKFYSTLDDPIENGEFLTFMIPFFDIISTANNVWVSIQGYDTPWHDEWWVAEGDDETDFTIRSAEWTEVDPCSRFYINITFFNASNFLYIWDGFSDFSVYIDDDSGFEENRFFCTNHTWAPHLYWFYFTPYHALQATNGSWENGNLPDYFYFEGMIVTMDQLEKVHHSDPWYIEIGMGISMVMFAMYTIADKIIFLDLLPDMNLTQFLTWIHDGYNKIHDSLPSRILLAIGVFVVQVVQFIVKWAPYVLAALLKGLNLFIFIPVWITCILIFNGLKRYFVVMARDGPEAASDYADEFLKNCVKYVKSQPIGRVVGRFR